MRIEIRRIYTLQHLLILVLGLSTIFLHNQTAHLCKMWIIAATVVSLLSVPVLTAPQGVAAPERNAGPQGIATSKPRGPDKCGPEIQIPSDPLDTCLAAPEPAASTSAFGILGLGNGLPYYYDWAACSTELVDKICDTMVRTNTTFDAWHFEEGPHDFPKAGNNACQMGFWLPSDPKASQPTVSRIPEEVLAQCKNIFGTLAKAVASQSPDLAGGTINLVENPSRQPGQYILPGAFAKKSGKSYLSCAHRCSGLLRLTAV